jgi:biopolymer transport protein ExbD
VGRRRGMANFVDRRGGYFKIQITSMVDMFVLLLVFLLKSFSTSPVQINPGKDMTLAASTSHKSLEKEVVKLMVSKTGIFVEDEKVLDLQGGSLGIGDLDQQDPKFITKLYEALDKIAVKAKEISKVNETMEFDGQIIMQADRSLPYELLQKVMYTASLAGYADLKLAVMSAY